MKIKYKGKKSKKLFLSVPFISLVLILLILCISASYARFSETLTVNGTVTGSYTPEPVKTTYTYYFQKPSTWATATPCVHMWNDSTGVSTTWPGVAMKSEGNNIYSITVDISTGYQKLMFTNGSTDTPKAVKTQHITLENCDGYIFRPNYLQSTKTVYFEDWYSWESSNIKAYAWNSSSGAVNKAWPGASLTSAGKIREGSSTERNLYSYIVGSSYNMIIFSNNGSKTINADLNTADADGAIWGIFKGSGTWHWELYGTWEKYE